MKMNETVSYEVSAINKALEMLNNITVVGVQNADMIVRITRILQNPVPVDDNRVEEKKSDDTASEIPNGTTAAL